EGRVAPILFGLKQSDIEQPLSLFQATLFEKDEILRLMKTINIAAGAEAREERQLETVFFSFWPKLEKSIAPKLERLRNRPPPRKDEGKLESERILQELLILARQQMRILASPDELFGKETLGLLLRIIHEPDGAAMRLAGKERDL